MNPKYDSESFLNQMREDLERRAESFKRVCALASEYERISFEYAAAYEKALTDGWSKQDLTYLPRMPKIKSENEN